MNRLSNIRDNASEKTSKAIGKRGRNLIVFFYKIITQFIKTFCIIEIMVKHLHFIIIFKKNTLIISDNKNITNFFRVIPT